MKRFLSTVLVLALLVIWVSLGLAGEQLRAKPYGPAGPGGAVYHVSGPFARDLDPNNPNNMELVPLTYLPELKQYCSVASANVEVSGDIEGYNPILSDVWCMNDTFSRGRDEAVGWIKGTFQGKPIYMLGRMTVDVDLTTGTYTGYWIFQEGVGTHYGVFNLVGQINEDNMSTGTYSGWVRKNNPEK